MVRRLAPIVTAAVVCLGASAPALAAPPQRERLIDTIRQAPDPTPGQVRDGNPFPGIIVSSDQSTPLGCSDPIFGTWGTYIYCQNSIVSSGVYIGVRTDYYLWAQGGWIWFYGFHCYPNGECHEV